MFCGTGRESDTPPSVHVAKASPFFKSTSCNIVLSSVNSVTSAGANYRDATGLLTVFKKCRAALDTRRAGQFCRSAPASLPRGCRRCVICGVRIECIFHRRANEEERRFRDLPRQIVVFMANDLSHVGRRIFIRLCAILNTSRPSKRRILTCKKNRVQERR